MPASNRQRPEDGRWGWGAQFGLVLGMTAVLWFARWALSTPSPEWGKVTEWLDENRLGHFKLLFKKAGLVTEHQCAELDVLTEPHLSKLDRMSQSALQTAADHLHDKLVFHAWLHQHHYDHYALRFEEDNVRSLKDLAYISEKRLSQITKGYAHDHGDWQNHVVKLRELLDDTVAWKNMETSQYLRYRRGFTLNPAPKRDWSMFITSVLGFGIAAAVMYFVQQRGQITTSKRSILEFVTGKYLAIQYSKVCWEWEEPQTVGKTVTFKIKFYQRNGRPYPISTGDNLLVEVMHSNTKIPPTLQFGIDVNTVSVAFTVHRAGDYKISIMVGARHIRGSPFIKNFLAGPLDPAKSGFVGQSTVVVCTVGVRHQLLLEPRDEYGNLCNYEPENDSKNNYHISVTENGSPVEITKDLQVTYEKMTKRIILSVVLSEEGCYQCRATYCGVELRNGQFTLLVLSGKDSAAVKKALAKKSHNVFYEARLLNNLDKQSKARKVFIYISPKQLTVKEFYLKVIPKRLFTFRVCPSTKFQFRGYNNQYEAPIFVVDDGSQLPIELAAKDRNIIAATFTNFLLKNIGGSETFKDKQDFFCHEIRQLHQKRPHEKLTIKILRFNFLESSMKAIKGFSTSDWCKNFEIVFQGEEALDWGGVRREWFELLCVELFDPAGMGLFRRFKDDNQGLCHPNPNRPPQMKLKFYEFAGKIVGKCLYESALGGHYRQLVKARFSRSFLAQLIGLRVNYKYFMQDDPDLYTSKIKYIEENDVDDMDLTFSEEEYKDGRLEKVIDLIPNGSKIVVNNQNKHRYLDVLAQYKLSNCVKDEIEAFLKGLNELIPDNLLSIFDENELELLMCGTGNYSITEFKDHHIICGSSPEFSKVLDWFWTIVSGFTREEMARLLQFTTGCSQLPPGGFAELVPKFQITAAPTYGNLPTAHTCFNQLCLPNYDSLEQFKSALKIALIEGNQGFGMI